MKGLLDLRKRLNKKRPGFERCDSYKRKEVSSSWRRPKGLQNKMRLQRHGKPAIVKTGYRNPSAVRGLSASGLVPVNVYSLADLKDFDDKAMGVLIGKVGGLKKIKLLEECKRKSYSVLNVRDIDAEISRLKSLVELRRKAKSAKRKTVEESKPAVKEREAEKKDVSKEVKKEAKEEPNTREQEKKEMEKVLTKRQ